MCIIFQDRFCLCIYYLVVWYKIQFLAQYRVDKLYYPLSITTQPILAILLCSIYFCFKIVNSYFCFKIVNSYGVVLCCHWKIFSLPLIMFLSLSMFRSPCLRVRGLSLEILIQSFFQFLFHSHYCTFDLYVACVVFLS